MRCMFLDVYKVYSRLGEERRTKEKNGINKERGGG